MQHYNHNNFKVMLMELYIGNIPKGARPTELKKLIKDTLRDSVFSGLFKQMDSSGKLDTGIAVAIHNGKNGTEDSYRYGRVSIDSSNLARLVLDNINGANLRGETLSAREIIARNTGRDRRNTGDADGWEADTERRSAERRRH